MAHETIVPHAEIEVNGEKLTVKIDHMLDENDEDDPYTGCYRVTINKYRIVNVEINDDAVWVESGTKEATDLSRQLGILIEGYSE